MHITCLAAHKESSKNYIELKLIRQSALPFRNLHIQCYRIEVNVTSARHIKFT